MTASSDLRSRKQAPQSCELLITALLICLLGFALLIHELDEKSLWGDELWTVSTIDAGQEGLAGLLKDVAQVRVHPPLHPLLSWVGEKVLGDTEFALRFPSVIFGTLSIAVLYALGAKIMNRRAGLVAMAVLATCPFVVLYSRTARYYSLVLFLSLVSHLSYSHAVDGTDTLRTWAAYTLGSTLAIYTFYPCAFFLVAQVVIALARMRHNRGFLLRFFSSQVIIGLLFLPWVGVLARQASRLATQPDALSGDSLAMWILSPLYPFFAWTTGESIYPWNPLTLAGIALGLTLAIRGLLSTKSMAEPDIMNDLPLRAPMGGDGTKYSHLLSRLHRRSSWPCHRPAIAVLILLPLFLTIFLVARFTPGATFQGVPNRAIFCTPFVYLLIGRGICTVRPPGRRLLIASLLGIVFGVSLANYYRGRELHNPIHGLQTEALAAWLGAQAGPGDVFVSDFMTAFGYYIEKESPGAIHFLASDPQSAKKHISEHRSPRLWLVLLCRAVDTESLATVELAPWLEREGYSVELTTEYAALDETYARVQELILGKPACRHKIVVYEYSRRPGSHLEAPVYEA